MPALQSPLQLKSYVPIGGSLTWIPVDGTEPNMRYVPGFDLQWYHRRVGINFSEGWHTDANARYSAVLKMKSYVHELFPAVPEFELHFNGDVEESCSTISGVHGVMIMYRIYGGKVIYPEDSWPDSHPSGSYFTLDEISDLKPFDLESNPAVRDLLFQMDVLRDNYGIVHGYVNYQGVLNTAFRLRGSDIFIDMLDEPETTKKFFSHIANTMRDLALIVQKKQRESGFYINMIGSSNCVMNMISPQLYEDMLFEFDDLLSASFERYAMHTCNWDVTPYISALRKLNNVGYIDMGADSDYGKVREAFPMTRRNVLVSPIMMHKPRQERSRIIDRIADNFLPCDISMASMDTSVPDEEIRWMNDYIMNHRVNNEKSFA